MGAPIVTRPTDQAYPPPQQDILSAQTETSSNTYPGPGETLNMAQTSDCSKAGTWVEYVNKQAIFSFQYPAESEIFESVDNDGYASITLFLKPYCYVTDWWGPKQVDIVVLRNTEKLSLEDFVLKQHSSDTSTDSSVLSRELANFSKTISVGEITALQVNGEITREAPHAYIPYDSLVIFVGLTETTYMPPFEPACPTTLDLYYKTLASVKFLKH